ncbi:NAD(P)H-dependent oxidoreductase subunit E [Hyphococcus luteus]|uniref:NADH-quinone oxidoreductase subunit E n=1 Tax=Hyphococcus luteus TaxID=2058213 RepID=A0A2S7K349_9PROT|nr:NAD(P)H-dependent oxidoreductase subunit E [Marinicaulis flavus]PQA86911.1 NADH-quinone oxidoreductase subunit E [Marinicaulis flavus]
MTLASIIEPYVGKTGGLISALHAVQKEHGFLPEDTEAVAADVFNLTRAEVKGVISFYHDFKRAPQGETVVRVCAAEACQATGGRALVAALEKKFALKMGDTSASKDLTLEPVYCLGLCSCAPSAMVGDRLVARANADKIGAVVEKTKKERAS